MVWYDLAFLNLVGLYTAGLGQNLIQPNIIQVFKLYSAGGLGLHSQGQTM